MSLRPASPAATFLLALALCAPLRAEEGNFAVTVAGLGAGSISYQGSETGGRYTATGSVVSTGLARVLYPAQVATASTGRVDGNRYRPASYRSKTDKRSKSKEIAFAFAGGIPKVTQTPPDRKRKPYHAAPENQKGVLDPMTTAFAILRDRPAALACKLDIFNYDGRERSRIRLSGGKREGDTLTCPGMYTRVAGFSPEDMAERVNWPFTVIYRVQPDGTHRVSKVIIATTLGTVQMTRR